MANVLFALLFCNIGRGVNSWTSAIVEDLEECKVDADWLDRHFRQNNYGKAHHKTIEYATDGKYVTPDTR